VQRITLKGNWSLSLWLLVAVVLIALFVGVPLLLRNA